MYDFGSNTRRERLIGDDDALRKRAKADTTSLILGKDTPETKLERPDPEADLEHYDYLRLRRSQVLQEQKALTFAHRLFASALLAAVAAITTITTNTDDDEGEEGGEEEKRKGDTFLNMSDKGRVPFSLATREQGKTKYLDRPPI
ncbi:uncharacterized protein KY384_003423 [Bacidia gigantensis]|uniref:uncharacterized protein n=1 Tax=Bacidia gigantensis TaxID=2732470 RepID=UPI001D051DD0|nr:uncharacterized protein KY384_003423 [Bacidia gigantensis]KAG8531787.1 hypothetical protein KY384_003423 [Bacidia gigantensis]